MSSSSSLHHSSSQHKPVIVRTPSFGTGIVTERRSDGISVVQLPWGKVFLDPEDVGQVISGHCKRTRYQEEEEAVVERDSSRRKQEEQSGGVLPVMQWQQSPQQQQSASSPSSVYRYPS